jgi:hypothetical protein
MITACAQKLFQHESATREVYQTIFEMASRALAVSDNTCSVKRDMRRAGLPFSMARPGSNQDVTILIGLRFCVAPFEIH